MAHIHVRISDEDWQKFTEVYTEKRIQLGLPPKRSAFIKLMIYAFMRNPEAFAVNLGDDDGHK